MLTDELILPEGMKEIDNGLFYNNDSIRKVVIPASVERIGKEAFSFCYGLEQVVFAPAKGNRVLKIEDEAFFGSEKLSEIGLPPSAEIGYNVFGETEYLYQIATGQKDCPNELMHDETLLMEDLFRICTIPQNPTAATEDFLKEHLTMAMEFSLSDNHDRYRDFASQRLKNIIDIAGTPKNINTIMETVIAETERIQNYELRAEMIDYQQSKGLYFQQDWTL